MTTKEPIHVTITGAAGQIAYSLLYNVARGDIYGLDQPVVLRLLDIPMCMDVVAGVVMELEDCALPLLAGVVSTTDPRIAFENADAALLVGAMPRKQGMERAELLQKNAKIFEEHGKIINEVAKKTIKVLVVGNPANTNALITMTNCPSIPRENFTCLTRLDHNRAKAQIALKANVSSGNVSNVIIWGNHSSTQYPDASHAVIRSATGTQKAAEAVDAAWLQGEFVSTVQKRGGAVIDKRKLSSAMSAAKAIVDHMRDWIRGTPEGEIVSMGVASTGHYGVPEGLIFSFPVTCSNGTYKIVEGLNIDSFSRGKIDLTAEELLQERKEALGTQ